MTGRSSWVVVRRVDGMYLLMIVVAGAIVDAMKRAELSAREGRVVEI